MREPDALWEQALLEERMSIHIPSADGYHFGDDHPWDEEDQASTIAFIKQLKDKFKAASEDESEETEAEHD